MKIPFFVLTALAITSTEAFADDCDFIRKAIKDLPAQGGEVKVPNGTYNCESAIVIDRNNVSLRGESQAGTVLRLADNHHAPILVIGDQTTHQNESGQYVTAHRVKNVSVMNLTFDGNKDNHDVTKECGETHCDGNANSIRNNGITIRGAEDIKIENVTAHSTISGGMVTEKYCYRLKVKNFESYNNHFDGFAGYETEDSDFKNMYLHDNRGAGISIDINFNKNRFVDSLIDKNRDVGIFARELHGNKFIRVKVKRSGKHATFFAAANADEVERTCARDNLFEDVEFMENKMEGFHNNNGCKGNKIVGNSNLCRNGKEGFVDEIPGSLFIADTVRCGKANQPATSMPAEQEQEEAPQSTQAL